MNKKEDCIDRKYKNRCCPKSEYKILDELDNFLFDVIQNKIVIGDSPYAGLQIARNKIDELKLKYKNAKWIEENNNE